MNTPTTPHGATKASREETAANDDNNSAMASPHRQNVNVRPQPDLAMSNSAATTSPSGVAHALSSSNRRSVHHLVRGASAASNPSSSFVAGPLTFTFATVKHEDDSSSIVAATTVLTDNNSVGSGEISLFNESDVLFWEHLDGELHNRIHNNSHSPRHHNNNTGSHLVATSAMMTQHHKNNNSNGAPHFVDLSMSDLLPIPLQVLASGAPVDADDDNDDDLTAEDESQEPDLVTEVEALRLLQKKRSRRAKTGVDDDDNDDDEDYVPSPSPPKKRRKPTTAMMPTTSYNSSIIAMKPDKDAITSTPRISNRKTISGVPHTNGSNTARSSSSVRSTPRRLEPQPLIVGADSHQMKVIQRIQVYLEESLDEEDSSVLASFLRVLKTCQARHARGDSKYLHLPGAIFEKTVEQVGGIVFARIYHNAKHFDHPRLYELDLVTFHDTSNADEPSAIIGSNTTDNNKCTETPNLLQIAIGYGIHLAKTRLNNNTNDNDSSKTPGNMETIVQEGAKVVMHMKDSERDHFWKTMVYSKDDE